MQNLPVPVSLTTTLFAASLALLAGCGSPTLDIKGRLGIGGEAAPASAPPTDVTRRVPPPDSAPTPVPVAPAAPQPAPAPSPPPVAAETPVTVEPVAPLLSPPALDAPTPIKVALLLPLSGAHEEIGAAMLDAAQLALFDVADARLVLLPRDTGGTPEGARAAAELALQEGAFLVLGPLFSASVAAAVEPARARGVNMVAFSTDRAVAAPGVYLMGVMPEQQIERVVTFARRQGLWRVAALIPDTAYGATVESALEAAAQRGGVRIARIVRYVPGSGDYAEPVQRLASFGSRRAELDALRAQLAAQEDEASRQALRRLEGLETFGELGYDAVLLPEGGDRLRELAPTMAFYDIDPDKIRFLGTALWDDPTIGREPSLVGGWFAGPPPREAELFRDRFTAAYGRAPPRIASLAYDAVALAAVLARAPNGPDFSASALGSSSGFSGIDGIFRFRPDGIAERGLAVMEVRPRSLRVISDAPTTFQKPGT